MHRLVFRPLLILLTLATLVLAMLQVGGRVLFHVLDRVENVVNEWLAPQGIRIQGLRGDWHVLDPIVLIDRIDVPAGYVTGVEFEVDVVESLARNTLVARRFALDDGDIGLEHTGERWRFRGGLAEFNLDVTDLFLESDELDIATRLEFDSAAGQGRLNLHYRAVNRGGAHRHRLQLVNPDTDCAPDCSLELGMDRLDPVLLVRDERLIVRGRGDGFTIPAALARVGAPQLAHLDASWLREGTADRGVMRVALDGVELAPDKPFGAALTLKSRGAGGVYAGVLAEAVLSSPAGEVPLPDLLLQVSDGVVQWWTPELEMGPVLGFLGAQLPEGSAGNRWLTGLDVRGDALNLRGYWNRNDGALGYSATLRRLELESFGGAPYLRGGAGELVGFERGMQIQLNTEEVDTHWRAQFAEAWVMSDVQGNLQAWFGPGYFGMRSVGLRLSVGESSAAGGFALNRVLGQPADDRLTIIVNADQATVQGAKRFVPKQLPAGLPEWLEQGPIDGTLRNIAFAYHGQIFVQPFELARRVEFAADIEHGRVQYHPDWPDVLDLDGHVEVAGANVRVDVAHGVTEEGAVLDGSRVTLVDNASYADVILSTDSTVPAVLSFIRSTPLSDWFRFITPDWSGAGGLSVDGTLHIPLKLEAEHIGESTLEDAFDANLQIGLAGADLNLPDYRVKLEDLQGIVTYHYPYDISAANVNGRMFGKPAIFGASADEDTVIFDVAGQAAYQDVLDMLQIEDPDFLAGAFDFLAQLHIELGSEVPRLEVVSDLTGLALDLPGEFAKSPDESVAADLVIRFLDDYQALSFGYGRARGWLHVDQVPLRGAIGFDAPPPLVDSDASEIALSGRVEGFDLDDVIPDQSGAGPALLLPIRLAGLEAGRVNIKDLSFSDVMITGRVEEGALSIDFDSEGAKGSVSYEDDTPIRLNLAHLVLPAGGDEGSDPLAASIIADLPRIDVAVDQFTVGTQDFGSWAFKLVPEPGAVRLTDLQANLRGIAISAPDGLRWTSEPNETRFSGKLVAGNLADVLPLWGFAPTLTSKSAEFSGDLHWQGSPANVDVDRLVGDATFVAKDGRFLEVDASGQGAMRLFSLVNFSNVLKRLNFDFSDVVDEGIGYDEIHAKTHFDEGMLSFTEPMKITGTGSEFRIGGDVNLNEGTLDSELIVTLPVTRSLPWYAAYIALANPLTAIGVLVGERVLRKPIEQFSTAKYTITGPIDNPELKFVNVWDRSMNAPKTALETPPDEAAPAEETPPPADPKKES